MLCGIKYVCDSWRTSVAPVHHYTAGLSQVPFIELQKVQEKIGSKEFSALLNRSTLPVARKRAAPSAATGKGMPREVTSKQPVTRCRQVVPVRKQRAVDPRFSEEYGQFDEDKFKKAYQFLDSVRQNEKDALYKELKRAKSKRRRTQLMNTLKHLVSLCVLRSSQAACTEWHTFSHWGCAECATSKYVVYFLIVQSASLMNMAANSYHYEITSEQLQ